MKKKMLLTILALLAMGLVHGATITVTQPAGGTVTMGCPVQVMWTAVDVASNVRVLLRRPGGALIATLATGLPASPGLYNWTVTAPAVVGETYKIHVLAADGSAEGISASFTVSDPPVNPASLVLNSPHGGESWEIGSTRAITWTTTNVAANCQLILLKNDQVLGTIRANFAPGQGAGSWNWIVGNYSGGPAPADSGYKVRIETVGGDQMLSAQSAGSFTIIPKPIVLAPLLKIEVQRMLPGRPDLVVCLAWTGTTVKIYQDIRVKVRVKNHGQSSAPASTLRIFIEDKGGHNIPVPALDPQGEFYWSKKFDWPTCGHKTIRAMADADGQVTESDENNNTLGGSINVNCGLLNNYMNEMDRCSDQN